MRLTGIKEEIRHIDRELRRLQPELRQAQTAYDTLKERIDALKSAIDEAESDVFSEFCEEVGCANIREFEERQLKASQEESAARLQFDTQIARLTHQ